MKIQFLDKYGWPVETIKGRWVQNTLRLIIHTRKMSILRRGHKGVAYSQVVGVSCREEIQTHHHPRPTPSDARGEERETPED